jgi:transposase-like protein
MSGTKGMLHYSVETKQRAVAMFLEEHRSYASIAQELGIRKPARIEAWVRMYRREGTSSFCKPIGRPRKEEREQRELERLRMENALLKKFQAELREVSLVQRNIG